jgi:hypothetical protein
MSPSPRRLVELSRRKLLQIGGQGLLGLTLPRLLQGESAAGTFVPRAKSVIFLFQWGGPSHLETFDRKPDAPDGIRGEFGDIDTRVPGLTICEHLPEMAKVMDRVVLIHGVQHDMTNHNSAGYFALTGRRPPSNDQRLKTTPDLYPAYGSVVDRFMSRRAGMPPFISYPHVVRDGSITPGQRASFLGADHDPLVVLADPNAANFDIPELSLPSDVSLGRLEQRREMWRMLDGQQSTFESDAVLGLNTSYGKAYNLLVGEGVRAAFDLTQESAATRERYGRTTYGQGCLLARRLVEAGVRFVNVYFSDTIGGRYIGKGGWDTHGFDNTRMFPVLKGWQLPMTDRTLPTLITDLDDRGLLDETLVVWMGEFGRTPRINENASRDHWPKCYTVLMAGGGLKRGAVVGESNADGAEPESRIIRPGDVAATMYALLGIDPHTLMHDLEGRPVPIADGEPLYEAFA